MKAEIKCPTCGFVNKISYPSFVNDGSIIDCFYCNIKAGGCDEKIYVRFSRTTSYKAKVVKIVEVDE